MSFKDLRETLSPGLELPIGGKTYLIKPISAAVGLRMQDLMAVAAKVAKAQKDNTEYTPTEGDTVILTDAAEADLFKEALGDSWDEMLADLSFEELKLCALTVIFHATQGADFAETYWNAGGKAPAPNRAERRMATRTRTGADSTTKTRASRSGTTTPKGTPTTA
jgi:hypothetical protein